MKRRRMQEGQALIAALVAMVILFSVAGGLAVGVSAALDSGSRSATYLRDVTAQSSSAAVMARVAGGPRSCPTGTLFGSVSGYGCDQIDAIAPSRTAMVSLVGVTACATAQLPATREMAVWLHSTSGVASVRIDASPSCGGSGGCDAGSGAAWVTSPGCGEWELANAPGGGDAPDLIGAARRSRNREFHPLSDP